MQPAIDHPPSALAEPRVANGAQPWLEALLVFAIFFIDGGAAAPHVNEAHYLTKAKRYWDASYCPGDLFLDSAAPHLAFYWTIGWLTKFLPLTAVAWIGRVAAWSLLAAGWQRLSRTVVNVPWAAALSAALWTVLLRDGAGNFAGEWVVGGVEAKCFAYGFLLFGMAALARGDWRATWIWLGAASAFHVLVGAWAVLAAGGVWLTEPRSRRPSLRSLASGLALGGFLALPGLLPALALERNVDPATSNEAAQIYVFERLPHHLAPLSLPAAERRWRLTWLGGMTAALMALWAWTLCRTRRTSSGQSADFEPIAASRILRFAGMALLGACVGLLIETALTGNRGTAARALRYYWFRQVDVAVPMAISLIGATLTVDMLRRGRAPAKLAALAPIVWCGWLLWCAAWNRWHDNAPPTTMPIENLAAWTDVCRWIDEQTPHDAMFLIPRWGHAFKWYAARGDVASHKDVPQDPISVIEWRDRCRELYRNLESRDEHGRPIMLDSPEQWGTARTLELAQRYGASHVIARSAPPLDLPVLYSTGDDDAVGYTVYATDVAPSPP